MFAFYKVLERKTRAHKVHPKAPSDSSYQLGKCFEHLLLF